MLETNNYFQCGREDQQTRCQLWKERETGNVLNIREALAFSHQDQRNITVSFIAASPGIHQRWDISVEIYPPTVPQHQCLLIEALQGEISLT
jgi:hypothetical protein